MLRPISSSLVLVTLCAFGAAQSRVSPLAGPGTPGQVTVNMATGEMTRDTQSDKAATLINVWVNTDTSGWYGTWSSSGVEWLDWGVITNSIGSDIAGRYSFGYATTVLDTTVSGPGVSMCTSFYAGALGYCAESGLGIAPDAQYCFSGLPGTTASTVAAAWLVTVTLTGGNEFVLPAGPFGFSLGLTDTKSGPLLCYAGDRGGAPDYNGSVDVFDVYVPDVASGTCGSYFFGGVPHNFSSWYLWISKPDSCGCALCGFYCGSGVNAGGFYITRDPVLGDTFAATVAHSRTFALLYVYDAYLVFPYHGEEILVDFISGTLLVDPPPSALGSPADFALPMPINLAFVGDPLYIQAVSVGGGVTLHCAYACTVGV